MSSTRPGSSVERYGQADTLLLRVLGVIDESFPGFGDVGEPKTVVMDVSAITRITSFGVRQWIVALERLPKSIGELYFLGCPTCFVDQLNMVLNFGGRAKVVTAYAPYECPNCGRESDELIDVLTGRRDLVRDPPFRECSGCSGMMELDETPESYFAFVATSGASSIDLGAAQLLASYGLYVSDAAATERPPRITKLVHGTVTYYRVNGTIGAMFRARPFLVGSEGEVVIDLADVDRCAPSGEPEWRRLLKTLAHQVSATTLVDIPPSLLQIAPQSVTIARNIAVASLLAPYSCTECGRASQVSVVLHDDEWPPRFTAQVCGACGGTTKPQLAPELLQPLHKASKALSPAAAKVVELRRELLSRALIDANVARAAMTNTGLEGQVVLGKYEIVRALSSGGMAEVFLAKQVGLDKPVAIKRIQSELMEHRRRAIELFLNEAKIAGRLTHPGIAQVLDVGEAGGAVYIAMEYVHGRDLRHVLKEAAARECALPIELACYIAREVAEALDYAYWSSDLAGKQLAVVHRDVSTHNVIVGFDGTVKLIDFGVAMSAITEHEEGLVVGKFQYMTPEAATTRQVGHRSDLFSLGVVLYMMCTGWAPFADRNPEVLARKKRNGEYPHLDEVMPEVPLELSTLVERMLAPDPVHRPERGREVASELNEIMRAYGGGSAAALAEYLRTMFPDAPPDPDAIELVRAGSASDSAKSDSASLSGSQSHPINPTETPTPSAAPTATATPTVTATPTPSVPTTVAPRPSPLATPAGGVSRRHQAPHTSFRDLAIAVGIGLAIVGTLLLAVYLMFIKD